VAKDCKPPIRERINLQLIEVGVAIMKFVRAFRRPGSRLTAAAAVVFTIVAAGEAGAA
jgi:hypothetical protein